MSEPTPSPTTTGDPDDASPNVFQDSEPAREDGVPRPDPAAAGIILGGRTRLGKTSWADIAAAQVRAVLVPVADVEFVDEEQTVCRCGNTSSSAGFQPCDLLGSPMDRDDPAWPELHVCAGCGEVLIDPLRRIAYARPHPAAA